MILNHTGTSEIETGRLVLRRFAHDDAQDMFNNWTGDSDVSKYMRWTTHENVDETQSVLNGWVKKYEEPSWYHWAICLKEDNKAIGSIGLFIINENDFCGDVGYCLCKKFWGKGITSEALTAVLYFAFNVVGFNRVEAYHSIKNPASGKVMQKAGMLFEGTAKQKYKSVSGFEDSDMYGVIKDDFNKRKSGI